VNPTLCIGVLLIGESTVDSIPTSADPDIMARPTGGAKYKPDITPLDATSSINFAIPQILFRSIALRLRGGNFGSITRFQCQAAKSACDGSHNKYDAAEDPPQRGQNGFVALSLPPNESRRADASKSEEKSQDWPG
jgi:hypothetical protein